MPDFPLEKILEVDIETYFKTQQSTIDQYNLVGVRFEGGYAKDITKTFANYGGIPKDAEIVLNYHVVFYDIANNRKEIVKRA